MNAVYVMCGAGAALAIFCLIGMYAVRLDVHVGPGFFHLLKNIFLNYPPDAFKRNLSLLKKLYFTQGT